MSGDESSPRKPKILGISGSTFSTRTFSTRTFELSTGVPESDELRSDRRRGLLLMLLATASFSAMALFVKLLREDGWSTNEVMFWRMAPGLAWVVWAMREQRLWPNAPRLVVTRSLWGVAAMGFYFYALRVLTMLENTVLHLLQPVFVALLAPLLLHERVRREAIAALVLALVGALIVLRPDTGMRHDIPLLAIVAGIAAALCSAVAHITVRKATASDTAECVVFWFTVVVSLSSLGLGLAQGEFRGLPAGVELLDATWKIAGMAGFGLAGQLLMTRAYGKASAAVVAMVAYSSIPFALLADFVGFGLLPGASALLGSLLLVVAGVLLVRGR